MHSVTRATAPRGYGPPVQPTNSSTSNERVRRRDRLAAAASGFAAFLALVVSTANVYLQREQIRAQVWPRLTWSWSLSKNGLEYAVRNRGVGPASVRSVRVTVDGKPVRSWYEAAERLIHESTLRNGSIVGFDNAVLSPGDEVVTLRLDDDAQVEAFLSERRRLGVEICFCSTMEECWMLRAGGGLESETQPVDRCPAAAEPFGGVQEGDIDQLVANLRAAAAADAGALDAATADASSGDR
jgi:hypothetical protein